MTKEYSPFTPGVPVPVEFFVGRQAELERFLGSVKKSLATKSIERLFVSGERGIGKSSLCNAALLAAERRQSALGLHVFLGGVDTLEEMVRRIFDRLLRESMDKPWHAKIREYLGNHIREVGIFGLSVEFAASQRDLARAAGDFIPAMRNLLKQLPEKKGLVLVLDDINGLASSAKFANWFKSLVDEMATASAPFPMTVALAGLPERLRELTDRQPSLARVFDIIPVRPFSEEETADFFRNAFGKAKVNVDDDAIYQLCRSSGGYPVFMHELGDAVFSIAQDGHVTFRDAVEGLYRGVEIIGAKYIEPSVLHAIRSEKYRGILKKIAIEKGGSRSIRRKDVIDKLTQAEKKVFDSFLRRMRELGAVRRVPEQGPGAYEFASAIHALFFFMWARAAEDKR